jgi:hypothetical protein
MSMRIESELTLVMTASVDPKGMPAAATLLDPLKRENDYLQALTYYLTHHPRIQRIVFAENSGWSADKFRCVADEHSGNKTVEFLSFTLNDFPREYGKGYGEMLLLDRVMAESNLVRSSAYVAKITGRNYLLNMTRLIERASTPFDLYADLRDHGLYELIGSKNCGRRGESRFFVLTPAFYDQHFRGKYATLDESRGVFLEDLIYNVVKQNIASARVIPRFPVEPDFRGIAGHLNKDYGSARERAKCAVRAVARKLTPWLWI